MSWCGLEAAFRLSWIQLLPLLLGSLLCHFLGGCLGGFLCFLRFLGHVVLCKKPVQGISARRASTCTPSRYHEFRIYTMESSSCGGGAKAADILRLTRVVAEDDGIIGWLTRRAADRRGGEKMRMSDHRSRKTASWRNAMKERSAQRSSRRVSESPGIAKGGRSPSKFDSLTASLRSRAFFSTSGRTSLVS